MTGDSHSSRKPGLFSFLVGAVVGIISYRLVQYLHELFGQPRLTPSQSPPGLEEIEAVEEKALHIAAANLRQGIEERVGPDGEKKRVLVAGLRNFREPWARDFGFASYGLLALNELQATRETLEAFMESQKPSGQLPVKLHSTGIFTRYLYSLFGREQPVAASLRPKYVTGHRTISLDGNALLVSAALNYAKTAGDRDFIRRYWEGLKRALGWLSRYALDGDGLLHQKAFADWADSIARPGKVMYTNVLFWKALADMAAAAKRYGFASDRGYFEAEAERLAGSINKHFWRSDLGYYVTSRSFDNLIASGNLLAIAWGLASREQANRTLGAMEAFGMASPVPTRPVHRAYPRKNVALENRLAGLPNYHTDAAWLWLGAWHVIALGRTGRRQEALEVFRRMASVIVRDGVVHEVYAPDGRFFSNLWYTSEAPLTWSAGLVVYACQEIQATISMELPVEARIQP